MGDGLKTELEEKSKGRQVKKGEDDITNRTLTTVSFIFFPLNALGYEYT